MEVRLSSSVMASKKCIQPISRDGSIQTVPLRQCMPMDAKKRSMLQVELELKIRMVRLLWTPSSKSSYFVQVLIFIHVFSSQKMFVKVVHSKNVLSINLFLKIKAIPTHTSPNM